MTYRGRVRNGVVVLDEAAALADGTLVRVEPEPEPLARDAARPPRGSAEAVLNNPARWQGDPSEVDDLLLELKRMKQAELDAATETWRREDAAPPHDS